PAATTPALSTPSTPPAAPRQDKPRKTAPPTTFKLKQAIEETPAAAAPRDQPPPSRADATFDLAAVTDALSRFTSVDGGVAMHAALTAYPPRLDNLAITLALDNDLLLAQATEILPSLLAYLQRELGNTTLTLSLELHDEQRKTDSAKRLYTAKDKFDYFLATHPAIQELKERFSLELP
ncbi:MAG: hypothetical protein LBI96_01300, partial [Odoribacteraceae bacterium]|nr:hypothetical protein [Odoribacteraceae bacterium]